MKKLKYVFCLIVLLSFNKSLLFSQNWATLGSGVDWDVRSMYTDTIADLLYVGGSFINGGGIGARGIASWNGSNWDTLGRGLDNYPPSPGSTTNGYPLAMCRYNNELYIGGGFMQAGTVNSAIIAKWNGLAWSVVPSGFNGIITGMIKYNADLYVCGEFDSVAGIQANGLAKWNGSSWSNVNSFPNYNATLSSINYIFSMAVFQGHLYVAGNFEGLSGRKEIVYWNGTQWQSLGTGILGMFSEVSCIAVYKNELYAGGTFTASEGNAGNYIQKWNGTTWSDVGGGVMGAAGGNGQIYDMKVIHNDLYVVGAFSEAGGIHAEKIAKWDGNQWCGFGDSIYSNIGKIENFHDSIFVGGMFTINADTVNSIAKWTGGNYLDTCGHITIGINENESAKESINVYPSPATNQIILELRLIKSKVVSIEIKNILGQSLWLQGLPPSEEKATIDISNLPSGIYFIELRTSKERFSKKFIKQT